MRQHSCFSSPCPFPETLPPLLYPDGDWVRQVDSSGHISFRNHPIRIGKAFADLPVGVRPHALTDGLLQVYFATTCVRTFDLRDLP
jgi:hypothetical protein